jgi:hypothetical protein
MELLNRAFSRHLHDYDTKLPWAVIESSPPRGLMTAHLVREAGRLAGDLFSSWTRTERRRHFAALLESFDPLYERLYDRRARHGDRDLIPPDVFAQWTNVE